VSRWLQQQVQSKYPQAKIIEALEASYGQYPVDVKTCNDWISTNSLTHTVLRDTGVAGSVAMALGMKLKDMMVLDRNLKILFRGQVTGPFEQNQVLSVLSGVQ
jgi:hypothetical protein